MDSRVPLALCTACAAGALALASARGTRRSDLHALLIALLAAAVTWSVGTAVWSELRAPGARETALRVTLLGVFAATPLWLAFALRAARPGWPARSGAPVALLLAPAASAYLAWLTNAAHYRMVREGTTLTARYSEFAGPWMHVFVAYASGCLVAAAGVLLAWAWRLRRRPDFHRAGLAAVAAAAALPLLTGLATLTAVAPPVHGVVAASLVASVLLLAAGPLRDRLLHGVPLAHRDVFDALRDGVVVANARGAIVDINPAAERLFGRPLAAMRGRELAGAIAELAAPERSSSLRRDLEDLAESTAPLRLDLTLSDGRRVEVRSACVTSPGREPLGRYALLRDRSDERRGAEVARRAQKLETVATLAAGVAHEVSNPLAFVRANLAEMERLGAAVQEHRKGGPSNLADELADLRGLAQEALEGIARIERIAAGVRRLSMAGEGFAEIELGPVVDEAVLLARIRVPTPLRVELALDPELPPVRGASALLVEALLHLLIAAQRGAGASEGPLRIEGFRVNGEVVLRVGGSCDADDLGLPIARDIARDHGGELEIVGPPAAPASLALRLPVAEAG
jgi:PAS domain S-box-containing protein